jgi:pimeloyl-ACP methyl ester carboxylesterase
MKVQINHIEIGYEIIGKAGLPLVLIHGFGLNRDIWRKMAEKYLQGHYVILPDVRGHGESQAPERPYSMTSLADDIAALLDTLEIEKAVLCGHSMGGYITLAFAEKYPGRLAGLGLITTHAGADSSSKRAGRYETIEALKERGAVVVAENLAKKLTKHEDILRLTFDILSKTAPEGMIGVLQGMAERPDRWHVLSEIKVPALVVAGKEDQIVDVDVARQMADSLTNSEFLLIDGAGHMPMLEDPGTLGLGLKRLLSKVEKA